ncbi:hypothetical protein ACI2L1_23075 [Streptomyces sp. NPDC019531]|uniref:hypothetical protein n=1 Tax=Streptomyces sp. NPDC019531 TaxID=3365062 RepID=UPI0038512174
MNDVRPVAYGYLRATADADDNTSWKLEAELRRYADDQGFELAGLFYENVAGCFATWDALTQELRQANAHHVIMPSFSHLTQHELLLTNLLERLERGARAEVHELNPR